MKSVCNKIWNFLDLLILKNFSKNFTSRSRSRSIFNSLFTLDLDFETFSFHFSLSISISRHFQFTFHFLKWVNQISISLFPSRTSNIHSRRALWDATLRVVENQTSILGSSEGRKWPKALIWPKNLKISFFIGPRCLWGLIYGLASLKLTETPFWNLTDVTLADEDTNSIQADNANRAILQCKLYNMVANFRTYESDITWLPNFELICKKSEQLWN